MKGKKQIGQKKNKAVLVKTGSDDLYNKICILVENSKASIAVAVNRQLTMLYWQIGYLIKHDILQTKKAGYGDRIIATLSHQLTEQYGKGWSKPQLWNCLYTVETFPDEKIISTVSGELSWSHLKEIIYLKQVPLLPLLKTIRASFGTPAQTLTTLKHKPENKRHLKVVLPAAISLKIKP